MPVLLVIVGLVILAITVYVALGRGGELSRERADYAPLDLGPVSATDVALLRPPSNGWGYNKEATDEALGRIAESVRERDVRIVALEQLVTDLSRDPAPVALGEPMAGARHRRAVPAAGETREPAEETGEPIASASQEEPAVAPAEPARLDSATRPQAAVPPGVWPTAPALTSSPASDAAAEETTAPQSAIREPIRQPEERPQQPPQQPEEQQPEEQQDDRQYPPERSHG